MVQSLDISGSRLTKALSEKSNSACSRKMTKISKLKKNLSKKKLNLKHVYYKGYKEKNTHKFGFRLIK